MTIFEAAARGRLSAVRDQLAAGVPGDARGPAGGKTPLHLAAENGHTAVVAALLEWDERRRAPLPATAVSAIEWRDDVGRTALHLAAGSGHRWVVAELLGAYASRGASVDVLDGGGAAPLDHAIAGGAPPSPAAEWGTPIALSTSCAHTLVMEQLLAAGAAVERRDAAVGSTPLHRAVRWLQGSAAEVLLRRGAAVDATDAAGRTALEAAAVQMHHRDLTKALLKGGADVNRRDVRTGTTMLMRAAAAGDAVAVQLLLEFEADPRLVAPGGKTALALAQDAGQQNVVDLMNLRLRRLRRQ